MYQFKYRSCISSVSFTNFAFVNLVTTMIKAALTLSVATLFVCRPLTLSTFPLTSYRPLDKQSFVLQSAHWKQCPHPLSHLLNATTLDYKSFPRVLPPIPSLSSLNTSSIVSTLSQHQPQAQSQNINSANKQINLSNHSVTKRLRALTPETNQPTTMSYYYSSSSSSSSKPPTRSSSYRSSSRYPGESSSSRYGGESSSSSRYPRESTSSRYGGDTTSSRYGESSSSSRSRDPTSYSSSSGRHDPYMGSSGYRDPSTARSGARHDSLADLYDIKDRSRDPYGRDDKSYYPEEGALTPPRDRGSGTSRGSRSTRDESEGLSRYSLDFWNALDPYAEKVTSKGEGERYLRY